MTSATLDCLIWSFLAWQLVLDYDDLMRIPLVNDYIKETTRDAVRLR